MSSISDKSFLPTNHTTNSKNFILFSHLSQKENEKTLLSDKHLKNLILKILKENCEDKHQRACFFKNQLLNQNTYDFLQKLKILYKNKSPQNLINLDLISSFIILGSMNIFDDDQLNQPSLDKMKSNIENFLFSLAIIYSENFEFRKCLIVIKSFLFLQRQRDFPNYIHIEEYFLSLKNNNLKDESTNYSDKITERNYKLILCEFETGLKEIECKSNKSEKILEAFFFERNLIRILIQNEFKTNFLILMLNSLISLTNSENLNVIHSTYKFLNYSKDDIINSINKTLSLRHYNNLTKVLCKMNENLMKSKLNEENLTFANLIKILLYDLFFSNKQTNVEVTLVFVANHINELILTQSAIKKIDNLEVFYESAKTSLFFNFIVKKIEECLEDEKKIEYANILGKIYNFYNNLVRKENKSNAMVIANPEGLQNFYSNKILQFYHKFKIVVNETFFIKVNFFRDFLNENKNSLTSKDKIKIIGNDLEELCVIVENLNPFSENDFENFLIVAKFLKKILENLLTIIVNTGQIENCKIIIFKIEEFFTKLLMSKKKLLQKKNEIADIEKFYNYVKLFNLNIYESETEKEIFSQRLVNFLNNEFCNLDDLKSKINILIIFLVNIRHISLKKVYHLLNFLLKKNFELYLFSFNYFIKSMNEKHTKEILTNSSEIEIILEMLNIFLNECDSNYSSSAYPEFENIKEGFLTQLEYFLSSTFIKFFEETLKKDFLREKINSDECESGSGSKMIKNDKKLANTNKFFNYYKTLGILNEKIKNIFKLDCNFHLIIFIEWIERLIFINEENKSAMIEIFLIENFVFKELMNKITTNEAEADFLMSFTYDYLVLKKDEILQKASQEFLNRFYAKLENLQGDKMNFLYYKKKLLNCLVFVKSEGENESSKEKLKKNCPAEQKVKNSDKFNSKRNFNEAKDKKKKIHFYESLENLIRNHSTYEKNNYENFNDGRNVIEESQILHLTFLEKIKISDLNFNILRNKENLNSYLAYIQMMNISYLINNNAIEAEEITYIKKLKSIWEENKKIIQHKNITRESNLDLDINTRCENIFLFFKLNNFNNQAEKIKPKDSNEILPDVFYLIDFYTEHKNIIDSEIQKKFIDVKEKLLQKMELTNLNLPEWIILICILFLQSNSFDVNADFSSLENFKDIYNLIQIFLEYSLDFMKLISSLASNYFFIYLKKKIFNTKKFLLLKKNTTGNKCQPEPLNLLTDMNLYLLSTRIQYMIKYTCRNFFKLSYRYNKSQEFYKIVIKLSGVKLFALDFNFVSMISRYSFHFMKNWYKKTDINPKSYEINFLELNFINLIRKLIGTGLGFRYCDFKLDNDNQESIFDSINQGTEICKAYLENQKRDVNSDKKTFINFFLSALKFLIKFLFAKCKNSSNLVQLKSSYLVSSIMENLNCLMNQNFFRNSQLLKTKLIVLEYMINNKLYDESKFINIRSEYLILFNKNPNNFDAIQLFKEILIYLNIENKKIITCSIEIFREEFLDFLKMISVKKIIDKYERFLQTVNLSFKGVLKYHKLIKKIITHLILKMIENNFLKEDVHLLLIFYIKNLINYNVKILYGNNSNKSSETEHNNNYMSFFKIKNKFIFAIYFNQKFTYSVLDIITMNRLIQKFKNTYTHFEEKVELEISQWWEQRVNLEKQMEEILFEFQRELFNTEAMRDCIKHIFFSNKKFLEFITQYIKKNTFEINQFNIENYSNEIVENLINNNNYTRNTNNNSKNVIKDFFRNENQKSQKNSKNFSLKDLYDDGNLIHLIISSELANFPIENIPIFYKLPIIRSLNYSFINNETFCSVKKDYKLSRKDIYYLLNPSRDLINTEERLKPLLKDRLKFVGIVGEEPNKKELWNNLKKSKFFIYSGHSNGAQYLDSKLLRDNVIECISILMGCSSVKIENFLSKDSQPLDTVSYYQINKCPAVLGCLWDVTDKDIDKFTMVALENLFIENNTNSLIQAMLIAKHHCYFKYLNSASLVLYGNSEIKIEKDFY